MMISKIAADKIRKKLQSIQVKNLQIDDIFVLNKDCIHQLRKVTYIMQKRGCLKISSGRDNLYLNPNEYVWIIKE